MVTTATQETSVISQTIAEAPLRVPGSQYRREAPYQADVLVSLKANIAQLEDLHGRLKYMMGELSYLLKKG